MVPGVDRGRHARMDGKGRSSVARCGQDSAALEALDADAAILLAELVFVGVAGEARGHPRALGLCGRLPPAAAVARGRASAPQRASGRVLPASGPSSSGCGRRCRSSPRSSFPTTSIVGARMLLNSRDWDASRPLSRSPPARRTERRSAGCPNTSRALVVEPDSRAAHSVCWSAALVIARRRDWIQRLVPDDQRARRARSHRRHDAAAAGRADCDRQGLRLQRFGRDAPCRGGRHAGDRALRADARARDRAAAAGTARERTC